MTTRPQVIVSGAGPVGLSAALGLARRGVRVLALEALPELSHEARASTFHPPTLEMFAEWGVLDEVLARGKRIDHLQFWERATRTKVADFAYAQIANDTPYPFRFQCPQSTVTRILAPALARTGNGELRFGHEVVGAHATDDGVAVHVRTESGDMTLEADYLIGADGSKSAVRQALGLGFTGKTYEDRFLLVGTDLDLSPFFPDMGPVAYIFDPDEWVIVMTLPDVVRVVFRLRPDEDAEAAKDETAIRARIAAFCGREPQYAIKMRSIYSVHQRVAETFRRGRIVLAGDAAHINNPAGGMGMNSGIHDAHMLVDALARVLAGESDTLLDRYAEARREVAVRGVQQQTDLNYRDLAAREREAREARNRELREAAGDPEKARAYLLKASMLDERIGAGSRGVAGAPSAAGRTAARASEPREAQP